jgi:hypothetical protein
MKGRIYVSGPMSGIEQLNFPLFTRTAVHLRNIGWEVINPAEINAGKNADWLDCMAADLAAMKGCTAICMLPGWEQSFGARIEHLVAQKLGLDIFGVADLIAEAA